MKPYKLLVLTEFQVPKQECFENDVADSPVGCDFCEMLGIPDNITFASFVSRRSHVLRHLKLEDELDLYALRDEGERH